MRPAGILLVVAGLIGIIWGGVAYINDRDAVHFGPIHVTENRDGIAIPPLAGVIALVVGGLLVLVSTRRGMQLIS